MNNLSDRPRLSLGYGDIGQRLGALSIAKGIPFKAVRRQQLFAQQAGLSFVSGDVTRPEVLAQVLDETPTDIVVTLTPDTYSEQGYRETYLACATALAEVVPTISPLSRILYVSSTSVYPQNAGEQVDENTDCVTLRSSLSATAKVLQSTEAAISAIDLPTCNLRFSGIYGPGRTRLLQSVRAGQIAPAHPTRWTNRIHADDCAGIIDFLFRLPQLPPCVVGTDCASVPKHDVHHYVAELIGTSKTQREADNKNVDAISTETSGQQEASDQQERGKRCSNAFLLKLGYSYTYPDYKAGFKSLISTEKENE